MNRDKVKVKVKEISTNPRDIRLVMEKVGNRIGSVHFCKRGDGSLRKMSYRLHVQNPSVVKVPMGKRDKGIDIINSQMIVYDVNKVIRNSKGEILGRGAFRTVPLENVSRVVANGTTYLIKGRST